VDGGVTDPTLIARLIQEDVHSVPYDPSWPGPFERERAHLLAA
jgi:GrpB-like predicted nucleotidyltransferase (UPF0157 family)